MLSSAGTRQSLFAATFAFIDSLSPPILQRLYAETVTNAFLKGDLTQNDRKELFTRTQTVFDGTLALWEPPDRSHDMRHGCRNPAQTPTRVDDRTTQ